MLVSNRTSLLPHQPSTEPAKAWLPPAPWAPDARYLCPSRPSCGQCLVAVGPIFQTMLVGHSWTNLPWGYLGNIHKCYYQHKLTSAGLSQFRLIFLWNSASPSAHSRPAQVTNLRPARIRTLHVGLAPRPEGLPPKHFCWDDHWQTFEGAHPTASHWL